MANVVVVGAQWGDEGKGKIVDWLSQQAEGLAQANDIRRCREAAQQMRRAGIALPPALIALAGLRLELLERKGP